MTISKAGIYNLALTKLGERGIESPTQDDPNARTISRVYDAILDAELRKNVWSFAIKRASIAADPTLTTWGKWRQYTLPNDFMYLIREDETDRAPDWRIEGKFIVSADSSPLQIRYVARITNTGEFDPLFIEAFASKIAAETCQGITGSTKKKTQAKADYITAINDATKQNSMEKPAPESPVDAWIDARN